MKTTVGFQLELLEASYSGSVLGLVRTLAQFLEMPVHTPGITAAVRTIPLKIQKQVQN